MKAIDLHNGIRRAIQGIQQPSRQCAPCRRMPVARFHISLPVRTFSSSSIRRAKDEPPKTTTSDASLVDASTGYDVVSSDSAESESPFTAAPEIDLGDEDAGTSSQPGTSSSSLPSPSRAQKNVPAHKVTEASSSSQTRQSRPQPSRDQQPTSRLRTRESNDSPNGGNQLRVVPASPSYFTSRPNFTDHYLEITALYRKHQLLPTSTRAETRITWLTLAEYKALIGDEPVAAGRYRELIKMCSRLSTINMHLMPDAVQTALQRFTKEEQPFVRHTKRAVVDEHGRAYGLGRRKTATARAWIVRGKGNVLVNGKSLSQYFARIHQRESAIYALSVTDRVGDYNVFGIVEGGGNTGQAEALTLAVAKALLVYEPSLRMRLKSAGCLTRDRRKVERKKPGHLKARKKPAWVKR